MTINANKIDPLGDILWEELSRIKMTKNEMANILIEELRYTPVFDIRTCAPSFLTPTEFIKKLNQKAKRNEALRNQITYEPITYELFGEPFTFVKDEDGEIKVIDSPEWFEEITDFYWNMDE